MSEASTVMLMAAYFSFALTLFVGAFALRGKSLVEVQRASSLVCIVAVTIAAAWRTAGTDYFGYSEHYQLISSDWGNAFEINGGWWESGFLLLALAFSSFHWPYDALMTSGVLVSLVLCYIVSVRLAVNGLAFLFALFCLAFMFLPFVRQDLAAAICLWAFYFADRKQYLHFAIAAGCAVLIHRSSMLVSATILFSCLYVQGSIAGLLTSKKTWFLGLVAVAAAALVIDQDRLEAQIYAYVAEDFVQGIGDESVSALRNHLKFLIYIVFVGVQYAVYLRGRKVNGASYSAERECLLVCLMLSVVSIFLLQITPVFARLSQYIFPFLALAYAFQLRATRRYRIAAVGFSSVLLLAYLYVALVPNLEWM